MIPRSRLRMVCRRVCHRFCKNIPRVFYTQFRRLKCRAFLALNVCLASVVLFVLFGCIVNCLRETPIEPSELFNTFSPY